MDTSLAQEMGQQSSVFGILDNLSINYGTKIQQSTHTQFTPENLFEQPPLELDSTSLSRCYGQKVVLIIGGENLTSGEISHQIAQLHPQHLVILLPETTHTLQQRLQKYHPHTTITLLNGHFSDLPLMKKLFLEMKPDVAIIAPHISPTPQTSEELCQLAHNLLFGTIQMARLALQAGCSHFIMVDNDPQTGAHAFATRTKRLAQRYCQSLSNQTRFISIYSQNALIVPISALSLFCKQIETHKSITITHPELSRHFMAIPTMVRLILYAGAMGQGGEAFILDSGRPVKLVDLAKKLIHYYGLQTDQDVSISFIGLRPGEKVEPNSYQPFTTLQPTTHPWLKKEIAPTHPADHLEKQLIQLELAIKKHDLENMYKLMQIPSDDAD